jgi:hypothetical protein
LIRGIIPIAALRCLGVIIPAATSTLVILLRPPYLRLSSTIRLRSIDHTAELIVVATLHAAWYVSLDTFILRPG